MTHPAKNQHQVMLDHQSAHAEVCFAGGFIDAALGIEQDLRGQRPRRSASSSSSTDCRWP